MPDGDSDGVGAGSGGAGFGGVRFGAGCFGAFGAGGASGPELPLPLAARPDPLLERLVESPCLVRTDERDVDALSDLVGLAVEVSLSA